MYIETERIIIDDIKPTDRENYFLNISHDKEVLNTFVCQYQYNIETFDVDKYVGITDIFAIRDKNTCNLLVIFVECDVDKEKKSLEIGYELESKHWGK